MLQNVLRHQAVPHTKETSLSLSSMRSSCLIRHTPPYIATRTCSPRLQLALQVFQIRLRQLSIFFNGKLHLQVTLFCFMENVHMSSNIYPLSFSKLSKFTQSQNPNSHSAPSSWRTLVLPSVVLHELKQNISANCIFNLLLFTMHVHSSLLAWKRCLQSPLMSHIMVKIDSKIINFQT